MTTNCLSAGFPINGMGTRKKFLQLRYDLGHDGLGVVFNSGIGYGEYEAWATIGDVPPWGERIEKVEVILIPYD